MIGPRVPESLVFLRDVAKRARKYEAGLAIVSHSVVDFLAPPIKMYGQVLFDIPCFDGLLMVGSKRLHVDFVILSYKFAYMGNKGGR